MNSQSDEPTDPSCIDHYKRIFADALRTGIALPAKLLSELFPPITPPEPWTPPDIPHGRPLDYIDQVDLPLPERELFNRYAKGLQWFSSDYPYEWDNDVPVWIFTPPAQAFIAPGRYSLRNDPVFDVPLFIHEESNEWALASFRPDSPFRFLVNLDHVVFPFTWDNITVSSLDRITIRYYEQTS